MFNLSARSSLILCLFFLLLVSHIVLERTRTFITHFIEISEKKICIRVSSAAVEHAFSSAGVVISQRRTSINPSTVNDILLVRSAAVHSKGQI